MKLTSYKSLSDGYREIYRFDSTGDMKKVIIKYAVILILCFAVALPINFLYIPLSITFGNSDGNGLNINLVILIVLCVLYVFLREAVRVVAMKLSGAKDFVFGYADRNFYIVSKDYYDRGSYIFVALAPAIFWGVVFGIVAFAVPDRLFWIPFSLLAGPIYDVICELYFIRHIPRRASDILVTKQGSVMKVYSKNV